MIFASWKIEGMPVVEETFVLYVDQQILIVGEAFVHMTRSHDGRLHANAVPAAHVVISR